jgi:hypothetical protein
MNDTATIRIGEQRQGEAEVEREYGPEVSLATRLRIEQEHLLAG